MKVTSIFPCQKQGFHPRNTSLAAPALQNLDQGLGIDRFALEAENLDHFGELQILGIDILGRQKTNLHAVLKLLKLGKYSHNK